MIAQNLGAISKQISKAAIDSGRSPSEITLIGVTKTKPLEMIKKAFEAGLTDVGENYVEDFSDKQTSYHPSGLNYHFIGRLPTKKVRKIVGKAHLIHSVGSIKLAKKIAFWRYSCRCIFWGRWTKTFPKCICISTRTKR